MTCSTHFARFRTVAAVAMAALMPGIASAQFQINGTANVLPSGTIELTKNTYGSVGTAFTTGKVPISTFNTSFQIHLYGNEPIADGVTFTIQNSPAGPGAMGFGGGSLGYAGITNSVAVKFDTFQNGGDPASSFGGAFASNSTGLFTGGAGPFGGVDVGPANLHQDYVNVSLIYDGTTLTESLNDITNGGTFTTSYLVNIPALVGGNTAYVGFTGATGGATSTQDINGFTFPGVVDSTTPEPGAFALLGGLGVAIGGLVRRRRTR